MRGETLLHRQIHPNFATNGRVDAIAFRPSSSHKGFLSTDDGDRITAEAAYLRYTTVRKLLSAGTMAITPDECSAQALPVIPDGDGDPQLDNEHVSIDFNGLSRRDAENKSKALRDAAVKRDWTHRP